MKISERCRKQIEDIEKMANEFKITGDHAPYNIVFWDRDFESITELYLAYKDFEDRCATLEAENEKLKHDNKELQCCNDNQGRTITMLREDNDSQFNLIKELKNILFEVDEENRKLHEKVAELHTIKKSFEVLRALYLGDYEDEPF